MYSFTTQIEETRARGFTLISTPVNSAAFPNCASKLEAGNGIGWKFDLETGTPIVGECPIRTFPARVDEEGQIIIGMHD